MYVVIIEACQGRIGAKMNAVFAQFQWQVGFDTSESVADFNDKVSVMCLERLLVIST